MTTDTPSLLTFRRSLCADATHHPRVTRSPAAEPPMTGTKSTTPTTPANDISFVGALGISDSQPSGFASRLVCVTLALAGITLGETHTDASTGVRNAKQSQLGAPPVGESSDLGHRRDAHNPCIRSHETQALGDCFYVQCRVCGHENQLWHSPTSRHKLSVCVLCALCGVVVQPFGCTGTHTHTQAVRPVHPTPPSSISGR